MIKEHDVILAQDQYYSTDCKKTLINNNVLVVGTAGCGKTRSIVSPNILQASGSYVISDPKGLLHKKYGRYLSRKGYEIKVVDFVHPEDSDPYNFFKYIHSTKDIVKVSHMLMSCCGEGRNSLADPFWEEAGEILLSALIAYLWEGRPKKEQNLRCILKLLATCEINESYANEKTILDRLFDEVRKRNPNSFAVSQYDKFRLGAGKTLRSVLIVLGTKLGRYDFKEMQKMTASDKINMASIGCRKTAVFVIISDKDRSMDGYANLFFTQTMDELCRYADDRCENGELPVPVRFIMDDFATNCVIADFPRMIASIRSRRISTMLMVQTESQLEEYYGKDGRTIIGNSDTYIYMGGNDLETARNVAARCDLPLKKILYMPVGTNWIFRRGQLPVNGVNFDLEAFEQEKNPKTVRNIEDWQNVCAS
ncbi:MAG: type IV secretory system conjugative DNA transfer family protein [Lachnospiraceae bacterium]|nr:type IV secretory system conjugative DNA transfer family protein [Lachnospiraceae bacterium]